MVAFLGYGFFSFLLSATGVFLVRFLARKYGWLAPPRQDRWHTTPTALYGGVGIFFGFIVTGLIVLYRYDVNLSRPLFIILFLGSLGSFLLGFFDDIFHFKPLTKLIGQIALSTLFIMTGSHFSVSSWQTLDMLLTYFWFLGIINAANLLDNMDGLSSGVVIIASAVILCLMLLNGNHLTDLSPKITFIFIMSILGFWIFNRYPATIFMGDAGSLFVGYTLAALALPGSLSGLNKGTNYSSIMSLLIPVAILSIPIFDTTLVTIARILSGRSATKGGKDHSSHRLVGLGFSEKMSVLILYTLAGFGGITAVLMATFTDISIFIFGLFSVFLMIIGLYLGKRKVYVQEVNKAHTANGWTPLKKIIYKKGFIEVALDIILISLSYFFACYLYASVGTDHAYHYLFKNTIPIVILTTIFIFRFSGIYKGLWNLFSIEDIASFVKACFLTVLIISIVNTLILKSEFFWQVYLVFGLFLFFIVVGSRLSFRFFDAFVGSYGLSQRPVKIILYGAGTAGKMAVDEIKRNEVYRNIQPIGFLDDDPHKQGKYVSGIQIIGHHGLLPRILKNGAGNVHEIWVSTSHINAEKINKIKDSLPQGVKLKKMKLDFPLY